MILLLQEQDYIQQHVPALFTDFYIPLCKMFCYMPHQIEHEFVQLLPLLMGPSTFVELFHRILDMCMFVHACDVQTGAFGDVPTNNNSNNSNNSNTNGSAWIAQWMDVVMSDEPNAVHQFWMQIKQQQQQPDATMVDTDDAHAWYDVQSQIQYVSQRLVQCAPYICKLLEHYFAILLAASTSAMDYIQELIPIMYKRMTRVCILYLL